MVLKDQIIYTLKETHKEMFTKKKTKVLEGKLNNKDIDFCFLFKSKKFEDEILKKKNVLN